MKILLLLLLIFPLLVGGGSGVKIASTFTAVKSPVLTVTLTTYTVDPSQTDSTPLITASGFKLDNLNPRRHRVIAISRDLRARFKFGSRVRITNAGRFNGVYVVRDLMNKRFRRKIDILINPKDKHTKLTNVIINKI
jgi:3D (Asp-Asp-Asp) domain-containing protein